MKLQVLISTMNQYDHSLLNKMNIQSDAIVVNQCDHDEIERFTFNNHNILWLSLKERGVGLSRNTALMRASGDILLFADDDVMYDNGYADIIVKLFEQYPQYDLLIFRVESINENRPTIIEKNHPLHWYNSLKYGSFRIALRKQSIYRANVFFSLLFGGGAKYQSGEDSLFIQQCLQKGLRGFVLSDRIGIVFHETSTWFHGINKKFFFDKGVLLKQCFGIWSFFVLFAYLIKNKKITDEVGFFKALCHMISGILLGKSLV